MNLEVVSDSGAARALTSRPGLERARPFQTMFLWAQKRVREGQRRVLPARKKNIFADLCTKAVNGMSRQTILKRLGFKRVAAST